jgi:hypothetical protein
LWCLGIKSTCAQQFFGTEARCGTAAADLAWWFGPAAGVGAYPVLVLLLAVLYGRFRVIELAALRPVPMWPDRRKTSKAAASEKVVLCLHATST